MQIKLIFEEFDRRHNFTIKKKKRDIKLKLIEIPFSVDQEGVPLDLQLEAAGLVQNSGQ